MPTNGSPAKGVALPPRVRLDRLLEKVQRPQQ